ncbi:hypothetical protein Tco_0987034 [Tanacetum coccineum]
MVPTTTPLVGFSGEIIWTLGQISLLMKIGDEEHSTSAWMNFLIVRSPSPYNGIIGRPRVRRIQAVSSTAHRMLKFPVTGGTVTLRSSRIIPLECTMVSGPGAQQPVIDQATEEKIEELCGLLRHNLDVFAWKPADITRVPRHIAEHMLNIREGCLPVRQKKRGQAPERNKAIYEEVEKLVNTDIMKDVHYHSWLSNSVMVKKHVMCMDFKDLKKACPKDGYPLSKIDWKYGNPPRKDLHLRDGPSTKLEQSMTNGREMTPPPGFSTPPQIPNITTSKRPPATTTVFAATTPKNTLFAYRASTSTNPNPTISPAFVEANYEILESLLRERRRKTRNEDLC